MVIEEERAALREIVERARTVSVDHTLRDLRVYLGGYFQASVAIVPPGMMNVSERNQLTVFRGRKPEKGGDRPRAVADFSYPPASKGRQQGRCNREGSAVFYASFSIDAIPYELAGGMEGTLYISRWCAKTPMPFFINYAGLGEAARRRLNSDRESPFWMRPQVIQEITERNLFINEALGACFVSANKTDYNFTNAVYAIFVGSSIHGLIYPTVAANGFFDNIAVRLEAADAYLELVRVDEVTVSRTPAGLRLTPTDSATPLKDGTLEWKRRPDPDGFRAPSAPISLIINPGQWWPSGDA